MPRKNSWWGLILSLGLLVAAGFGRSMAVADPGAESGAAIYAQGRGRHLYTAAIGAGSVEVPGRLFPCINCHKADGLGVAEGGLKPRDVTWHTLTRPIDAGGRGYDEATLRRAIRDGIDALGQPLGSAMPHYRMEDADLSAVIAYLRTMQDTPTPGVSGEDIQIDALLPLHGSQAEVGRAIERFLNLAVRDLNTRRRFDGRRVTLVSVAFDMDVAGDALRAVTEAVTTRPPFAFIANYGAGADDPVQDYLAGKDVPNIGPLTPPLQPADHRAVWIEPSVADQAQVLVQAALRIDAAEPVREGAERYALIAGDARCDQIAAAAVRDEVSRAGAMVATPPPGRADVAGLAAWLTATDADTVLFFGQSDLAAQVMRAAAKPGSRPRLFGRRQQLERLEQDRELQRQADIYLVTTYGGVEPHSRGAYDFRRVAGELGGGHPELLRDAYVDMKLLETILASSGRHLTQSGFLSAIESLRDFQTGVMPPLSFDALSSRRDASVVMRLDADRGRLIPLTPGNTTHNAP